MDQNYEFRLMALEKELIELEQRRVALKSKLFSSLERERNRQRLVQVNAEISQLFFKNLT